MYDKNTLYIMGISKTNNKNAITSRYNLFYIGFVVESSDGKIIDLSCSSTIRTTEEFIKSIFINESLSNYDDELEKEIYRRYHGSSQKAIIVAYKHAVTQYKQLRELANNCK